MKRTACFKQGNGLRLSTRKSLLVSGLPRPSLAMRIVSVPLSLASQLTLDLPLIAAMVRMPSRIASTNTKTCKRRWMSTFDRGQWEPLQAVAMHLMAGPSLIHRQPRQFNHQPVTLFCTVSSLETGTCPVWRILSGDKMSFHTEISLQRPQTRQALNLEGHTTYPLLKTLWKT